MNYLYINSSSFEIVIDEIIVTSLVATNWDSMSDFLSKTSINIDGVLIHSNLLNVNYDFISLANSLYQRNQCPIILLCEDKSKFTNSLILQLLFNQIYTESDIVLNSSKVKRQLISLAQGYKVINAQKTIKSILQISKSEFENLDIRFQAEFDSLLKSPSHEIARFILREVIEFQGILIDENVLAARLGVDISKSDIDWNDLKKELESCKYNGVFGDAWERWWWFKIANWWNDNFLNISLRRLSAHKRVEAINTHRKLNLVSITTKQSWQSDAFWTVCIKKNIPIDITDGFTLVKESVVKTWQEKHYVSIDYIYETGDRKIISLIEYERLEELKKIYED